MSDSFHFYRVRDGKAKLLKSVTTGSQARKAKDPETIYGSVTSALSYMPSQGLDRWKVLQAYKTGMSDGLEAAEPGIEAFLEREYDEIIESLYGHRRHPKLGRFTSAEFGTKVHAEIERHVKAEIDGAGVEPDEDWYPYCVNFFKWQDEQLITPLASEHVVIDHDNQLAGTMDYIGMRRDTTIFCDFKVRDGNKTYDKDCAQLASEACMWFGGMFSSSTFRDGEFRGTTMNLRPDIYSCECWSIIIDSETGKIYPKKWSDKMLNRGLLDYTAAAYQFNVDVWDRWKV